MKEKTNRDWLEKLCTFVVDKRKIVLVLYLFAFVFSVIGMGWVHVEEDVAKYLPEETETRQGVEAMNANFESFGMAQVMVSNITYEKAEELYDVLVAIEGVSAVVFDDSEDHYKDASALYDVNFTGGNFDEESLNAVEEIRQSLSGYDVALYTQVGYDQNATLAEEMAVILVVAVVIVIGMLMLTSQAFMEVPVLLLTFGAAALLNMGTNFIYGTVSFISDSVAVVLQMAMSLDYAVILCHRFSAERKTMDARNAVIVALRKAIPEVSASSLTTISGLMALGFMKFGIGMDMALVLIKAILFSLLSVFTLMPGLLLMFSPLIEKTKHRKLLPNIDFLGKFAVKSRRVLPLAFLGVIIAAFFISSNCPYVYSLTDLKTTKMTEQQYAYFDIKDTFGATNTVALLVPAGDYEAESRVLEELNSRPEVKGTMGLAGIEAMDGYKLTDALNPRQLSELIGLDYEVVQLLYTAYAAEHDQYGQILNGAADYEVPLFDMFLYLKDQMDSYNINLSDGDMAEMTDMLDQLEMAKEQMKSENYSRLVVYLNLPEEGEETYAFLQEIRNIIGRHYEGDDYYVVGNATNSRDLSSYFASDNMMISLLSAFFVIVVLLFTFKSAGLPVLLIMVIQGSIWITFALPTITNTPMYFLGYLIVNAIMMGANIDYAIVISSHYLEKKQTMPHKEAIIHALNSAFPTVFTSGIMMASAGLLIGNMSAQPAVSIMGMCIGRGTLISVLLVLFVLPSILVLGDSIIHRTKFKLKVPEPKVKAVTGTVRVRGRVRGYVSGYVDAEINGVLRGQLDANVSAGEVTEGGEEDA